MKNGMEIGVEVLLNTHLKTQTSNLKSQFSDLSSLSPQTSNLKSQISIRKERTHGYKNTGGGSQELLDAGG